MILKYIEPDNKNSKDIKLEISTELIQKDLSDIDPGSPYEDYISDDNAFGFNN